MKLAALFSGGKDSTFAIYKAVHQGHKIAALLTIKSLNPKSFMYHSINIEATRLQADAMALPQIFAESMGEKEKELKDLEKALKSLKDEKQIEGVVCGAIASEYQKTRVEALCNSLDLNLLAPLWHRDEKELMNEMVAEGFEFIVIGIFAQGLEKEWLGRRIDKKAIDELSKIAEKHKLRISGEGGELETFVLDAPIFRKKLIVKKAEAKLHGITGEYLLREVELREK